MPELPEVETVRRELEAQILHKTIVAIEVQDPVIVRGDVQQFTTQLEHQQFKAIMRRGKLLQFQLSDEKHWMMAHLKMTGQFLYKKDHEIAAGIYPLLYASVPGGKKTAGHFREQQGQQAQLDKHNHLQMHFEDGSVLSFRDQRKFGYLHIVDERESDRINQRYGIDPLFDDFTEEAFLSIFDRRKKSLKAVLMDQQLLAGVGNIYADEICFRVGIRPQRSVARLSKAKKQELFTTTKAVILEAVDQKGTTFRDFQRSDGSKGGFAFHLQAYGRTGAPCLRCEKGVIQKVTYLGRGTHYCPNCQS